METIQIGPMVRTLFIQNRPMAMFLTGILAILIVLVVLIILQITGLISLRLDKDQAAFWDTLLKGFGGIVAIIGVTVTVSTYFEEKRKENYNRLLAAQAPFFSKRQDVYFRLVSATAIVGNVSPKSPERREAESQFWRLYWGDVPLVADEQVARAIDAFSNALYPANVLSADNHGIVIRNASMNLARACRASLGFQGPDAVAPPDDTSQSIASSGHAGMIPLRSEG
jgi:hypothetical protein